jgi:hypothetical protein
MIGCSVLPPHIGHLNGISYSFAILARIERVAATVNPLMAVTMQAVMIELVSIAAVSPAENPIEPPYAMHIMGDSLSFS